MSVILSFTGVNVVAASDVTAPILSSPTGTQTGQTTADGTVTTDEDNGTLYYLVSTNATENLATVKAGLSQAVSATGSQSVSVSGLTAATSYYLHYAHTDSAANDSAVVSSAQFTTASAVSSVVLSFTGVNVVALRSTIASVTNAVAGGTITVNTNGEIDLTGVTINSVTYSGISCADVTVIDADTFTATLPLAGFNILTANDLVLTADSLVSPAYSVQLAPKLGQAIASTVDYANLHPDSPLSGVAAYSELVIGDIIECELLTQDGYSVDLNSDGLVEIVGANTDPDDQLVLFALHDVSDTHHRSEERTWTITSPINNPQDLVSIDSVTPSRTSAIVVFSYPGSDITGFQYNIGGSWLAATSPLTISGLTVETTYTLNIRPVNNSNTGTATSTTFTTQDAVDASPNAFTLNAITNQSRSVYATSNAITILGVDAGVDIPVVVTNGEYSVSTNNGSTWGAWTASNTDVRLNYQIRVRHLTSALYNTPIATTLNAGSTIGTFTSTTLVDAVPPVITVTGGNVNIAQYSTWTELGYSAIDNADGDISVGGVVVTGSVNTNVPGVYTLTYTATDAAGNSAFTTRTVTVTPFVPSDTQAPVISLIGGNRTINEGDTWSEPGYSATDNVDGNITNSVVITGSVNANVPGIYTLTYTATDQAGNTSSVTRTVTVLAAIQYPTDFAAPASRTFVAERLNRIEKGEAVFIKQVDEILDYDFDLSEWLTAQNDTLPDGNYSIALSSSDLVVVGSGIVPGQNRVKVWLSGGKAETYGTSYAVELTIITETYRRAQFLIRIVVIDRLQ